MILRDPPIRAALVEHLRATDPGAAILHEIGLRWHSVRADVVAVSDDLHGYEIKSDGDSLARLRWQVKGYEGTFDFCSIAVTTRHLAKARATLPASWGILVAASTPLGVGLRIERAAARNWPDPKALVRQLWRDDVVRVLRAQGIATRPRALVDDLWSQAEKLPLNALRAAARAAAVAHGDAREDLKAARAEARAERDRRDEALARFVAKLAEKEPATP